MVEKKFSYYQFHKELDYQVYLRLEDFDLESQLADIFESMGFDKVERNKIKDRKFDLKTTKILCINRASFKVCRQINLSHHLDVYGPESLSISKDFELYK